MKAISKYFLITGIFFCKAIICIAQDSISRDSLFHGYVPQEAKYDTIDGVFLYENLIKGYLEGDDAVVKDGGYVRFGVVNKKLYQQGIFIYFPSDFYYRRMSDKNPDIHFDTSSIFKVFGEMRYKAIRDGTLWSETDINPFCGIYYKKYCMKIEVLYLGLVGQKIPLFMNCKDVEKYMRRHKGKKYEIVAIPTYLITRVFNWKD